MFPLYNALIHYLINCKRANALGGKKKKYSVTRCLRVSENHT